jgi:hypothetical protein
MLRWQRVARCTGLFEDRAILLDASPGRVARESSGRTGKAHWRQPETRRHVLERARDFWRGRSGESRAMRLEEARKMAV